MKKQKIISFILITFLVSFFTVNAELNPLADGAEMGDMKYNSDGSVEVLDVKAEENNLQSGDDIQVTDEESRVGDLTSGGAEYSPTPTEGTNVSSDSSNSDPFLNSVSSDDGNETTVASSTGNGNVDELPNTGPEEIFILIFSLLLAGLFYSKKLKKI